MLGSTLGGSYALDRILGQGRHGALFEARNLRFGNRCAVRVLRVDGPRRDPLLATLGQHGTLSHPYLSPPRDVISLPEDQILLVSPLLSGQDLNQRVAAHGKLSASEGVVMMRQAAAALFALHQKGLCHGNLTASNIFFTRFDDVSVDNALGDSKGSSMVQLIDAGLALLDGAKPTPADDQRSLGRIVQAFVADLTSAQRQVLERTQSSRPESRFPSIAELWRAFDGVSGGKKPAGQASSVATAVVPQVKPPARRVLSRRTYIVAGAALLGLCMVLVVAALSGRQRVQPQPAPQPAAAVAPASSAPPPSAPPEPEAKAAVAEQAPVHPAKAPEAENAAEKHAKKKKKAKKAH